MVNELWEGQECFSFPFTKYKVLSIFADTLLWCIGEIMLRLIEVLKSFKSESSYRKRKSI